MGSRRARRDRVLRAQREVRLFFLLTFRYSWTLWGLAALSRRDASKPPAALLHVLGGIGPSLIGGLMVQRCETREGRRDFWQRVVDPRRIPLPWYSAIAAAPACPTLLTRWMQRAGGSDTPDTATARAIWIGAPISGLSEELGWRGFALDRLQMRYPALKASLLLGAIWSLWHLPLFFIRGTYQQRLGILSREAPLYFALDIPRAVLTTWIYNNTRRSILGAVLLHAAENVSMGTTQGGRRLRLAVLAGIGAAVTVGWGAQTLSRVKK